MKLGCIVLAHDRPEQLARLLALLRHPDIRLYLHVDSRRNIEPFRAALGRVGMDDVAFLNRHPTRWGGPEVLDAAVDGLARAFEEGCTYFTLISGQDWPLRSAQAIVDFFASAGSRSFLSHFDYPAEHLRFGGRDRIEFYSYNIMGRRETCIPRGEDASFLNRKGRVMNELLRLRSAPGRRRRFPNYLRPVGGWLWWNLSREAAEYVLEFLSAHPDYRRFHEHGLSPDEVFFQSILVGTDYATDHEVINDSLRFTIWEPRSSHPRTLTTANLQALLASDALFARKFDEHVDAAVLEQLPVVTER